MPEVRNFYENPVLLPQHYLPCLEYFVFINEARSLIIESHENFQKQSLRNRCYVQTANGVEVLSVPIHKPSGKVLIRDIRIDYSQPWQKKHQRCLTSAYANSPFFEFYAPDIFAILDAKPTFLFDLNDRILTLCLKFLKIKKEISYSASYQHKPQSPVFDARSCINDKKNVNRYVFYHPYRYYQTFGNSFSSNLSIVDLLFNMGPEAPELLNRSVKNHLNTLLNEL